MTISNTNLSQSNLFKSIKLGDIELKHRIVLAPLTRLRNNQDTYKPDVELASKYYSQRSQRPGTLIITEAIQTQEKGLGYFPGLAGIWNDEQIKAWSEVFDVIHRNESFVVTQLVTLGRQAHPEALAENGFDYTAPSPIYIEKDPDYPNFKKSALKANNPLRALTLEEIKESIESYVTSAKNSIKAGADGVQIHAANGYLLNQFLDPSSNQRTDEYGGSIENRSRIILEITDRLFEEIGSSKVSIRLSPYGIYGGLKGIYGDPTLLAQYAHLVGELELRAQKGQRLQFLDVIVPRDLERVKINTYSDLKQAVGSDEFISTIWKGPIVKSGNYGNDLEVALKELKDERVAIAIGRHFISNPDLPDRLEKGYPLAKYNRDLFYTNGSEGYIDYPNYKPT